MAKSHPAELHAVPARQLPRWARNTLATVTLAACFISLHTILGAWHDVRAVAGLGEDMAGFELGAVWADADTLAVAAPENPNFAKYRAVGEYLARRYRVSSEMTTSLVAKAHSIGDDLKIDPLLILAVIAVESRFNPLAESVMGAKGLMQIIPRFHSDKFRAVGGEKAAFDPHANIAVGATILKEYLRRTGDVANALQLYVGASTEENENGYSDKVMAERDRLSQVLRRFESKRNTAQSRPAKPLAAI